MTKKNLALRVARALQITPAAAADQLDQLMSKIRERTRNGQPATIPGLGTILPAGAKTKPKMDAAG
jgi:nucleoid DNA-binding protein